MNRRSISRLTHQGIQEHLEAYKGEQLTIHEGNRVEKLEKAENASSDLRARGAHAPFLIASGAARDACRAGAESLSIRVLRLRLMLWSPFQRYGWRCGGGNLGL